MTTTPKQNFIAVALVSALAGTTTPLLAQGSANALERPAYRPWTLGIQAGTTGAGGSLSWRFADHFGVRSGFDYFEYSDSGFTIKDLTYNARIRVMSEPLTLDIYPWKEHSFHLSAGLQFNQNQVTGTAVDSGTIIPPAVLGTLSLKIEQQPINPYLSIGGNFFYFDRAHHWAFGGELGVAYAGDAKVSLTSTLSGPVIDAGLRYEQNRIKDYANQYRWWPVIKLSVSYAF